MAEGEQNADAVKAEAQGTETVTVEYKGGSYVLPSSLDDVDGDILDALDDRKVSHVLKGLLGVEQWVAFKKTKPKVSDYNGLFEAYVKLIGLESTGN
jgi:hypothetical protein